MKSLIILFALLSIVYCDRHFHLGKELYGVSIDYNLERSSSNVEEKWFLQILDHFQPQDTRTWKQRYFRSSKYDNGNGPIFLEISGEGPMNADKFETSYMADNLARNFNALSFQLEHRYYGQSQPFSDWSTQNLKYLSSELALADLANFIESMNESENLRNRKWIIFGGSYAGNLAAWMRLKYPHLVSGSIASSAPVLAQLDFPQYMEVVSQSLGRECSESVKESFVQLKEFTKSTKSVPYLMKMFNLCNLNVNDHKTVQNFLSNIIDLFAGIVQYNEDNKKGNNVTIDDICAIMTDSNPSSTNLMKLSKVYKLVSKEEKECNDVTYKKQIQDLRNITIDFKAAGRQWTYQTCTEFGYYQTTETSNQPFPIGTLDLKFFTDMCREVYGEQFTEDFIRRAIRHTNIIYGGRNLKADKVFLLNGSIDPWHALSVVPLDGYQYLNTTSIYIKGTAHCADMYATSPNDKPSLIEARNKIAERINVFLQ